MAEHSSEFEEKDVKPQFSEDSPSAFKASDRHEAVRDPLLECLVVMTKIKQKPYSGDALIAGLPLVDYRLTPQLFIRAAERAGLASRLVKRSLQSIPKLVLPVVLLLENGNACILQKIYRNGEVDVRFPEMGMGVVRLTLDDLNAEYTGYALYVESIVNFDDRAEEYTELKPKSWFWGTIFRYKKLYGQVILAAFFINLFSIATPLFVMNVYDRVVPNDALETLVVLAIGVIIIYGFDITFKSLRAYFIDIAGKKVDIMLASAIFQQVLHLKMMFKPKSTGAQANHLREFEVVRDFFTSATLVSLIDVPFIFIFLVVIYYIGGHLVLVPLIAIPLIVIVALLIQIPMQKAIAKAYVGGAQKHSLLVESISNLEVLKSMSAEGQMQSRWEKYVGITAQAGLKSRMYSNFAMNFTAYITQMVTVGVVIVGVFAIANKEMTIGALIACTILSGRALAPLGQVTNILIRFQQSRVSLAALNTLMSLSIDRPKNQKFLHRPSLKGDIEFQEVCFNYPEEEKQVLIDVSFKLSAEERVGIIGSMGSGKSTLHKLILGFYPPTSGSILIDGTDIAQIDPVDLRRQIGYVPQENSLLFGTVRDNIAIKAPWCDDQEILKVAKISGVDNFIRQHSAGYDMPLGERGAGLSGGQCQAICVARSLLLDPSMLLFDEPTSAMDNVAEQIFINNMTEYMEEKTLILVTHKASILPLVNRIIVLQNGRIIADGEKEKVLSALKQAKN